MSDSPYLLRLAERLSGGLAGFSCDRRDVHRAFLLSQQQPDGGFCGRGFPDDVLEETPERPESDLYYTSFAVRSLVLLQRFEPQDAERVAGYLQATARRAVGVVDLLSWLHCALMVQSQGGGDVLSHAGSDWPVQAAAILEEFRAPDGGYAKTRAGPMGSTYHSFLVALCYELLGRQLPLPERLVDFTRRRQREDGGFVELAPMERSGTNPTAAAVALLQMFHALDAAVREGVRAFLQEVRSADGGFQANSRIPFPDGLSTFTACLTCLEIDAADLLAPTKLSAFLKELELPSGGFRAAAWDRQADVEYTYYGLGLAAMVQSLHRNRRKVE